jgi:uncharacterized membrane-anchored protein
MSSAPTLREPWLWIIILALILIMVLPLVVIWFVLTLPPELAFVATIIIVVAWAVAAGYRDWLIHKRSEDEKQKQSENL